MTSNKNTKSTPDAYLVSETTTARAALTKHSPPLDSSSTFLNPLAQDPITVLFSFPSNTPIPDATITLVDPTEEFKKIVSDITEALLFLVAPFSYEPETVILQMEYLNQELTNATATYKAYFLTQKNPFWLRLTFRSISSTSTFSATRPTPPWP